MKPAAWVMYRPSVASEDWLGLALLVFLAFGLFLVLKR